MHPIRALPSRAPASPWHGLGAQHHSIPLSEPRRAAARRPHLCARRSIASKSRQRRTVAGFRQAQTKWVTFGRLSVHSQNDVAGTRQRHSGLSQKRQYGDFRLRTLVTGAGPRFGGGGKPQRIIVNSRSPSRAVWTTGAIVSGKTPGRPGKLPEKSRWTRKSRRIASWVRVML
jgi:hypothetical protein